MSESEQQQQQQQQRDQGRDDNVNPVNHDVYPTGDSEDDWSYSDEDYELAVDGIHATDTRTRQDENALSMYARPDLAKDMSTPVDMEKRMNEEYIFLNEELDSYNSFGPPNPDRTRMLAIGPNSAWALECIEPHDEPVSKEERQHYSRTAMDLLWTKLDAMTLRVQVDQFLKLVLKRFRVDDDARNREEYQRMVVHARQYRETLPEKTFEERAEQPSAMSRARALMGIPKARKDHPKISIWRMRVVERTEYQDALKQRQTLLTRQQDVLQQLDRVCQELDERIRHLANQPDLPAVRKKLKTIRSRLRAKRENQKRIKAHVTRLRAARDKDVIFTSLLDEQVFPDARHVERETGAVFEYMDRSMMTIASAKRSARPIRVPREPDARDVTMRNILMAKVSGKFPKWRRTKHGSPDYMLRANGTLAMGQFVPSIDRDRNPNYMVDRVVVVDQFLDDAWPNVWGQPVWTTRISVRYANDWMRSRDQCIDTPTYYIRDVTHSLGRVVCADLASPSKGREQLFMVTFENQCVMIQPQDLPAMMEVYRKQQQQQQQQQQSEYSTESATDKSGTEDYDEIDAALDAIVNGKTRGKKSKKKQRKRGKRKKPAPPPPKVPPADASAPPPKVPLASAFDDNATFDSFDTMTLDDVKEGDIMQNIETFKASENPIDMVKTRDGIPQLEAHDLVWARAGVFQLCWSVDSGMSKTHPQIITSACIDNASQTPEEGPAFVYVGSCHGMIYKIVWIAGECIDFMATPQETPILDMYMQTPHLLAKTVSDVFLFHGNTDIHPFQTETGFCAGASVCGALMATLLHSGLVWIKDYNLGSDAVVRKISPTQDVVERDIPGMEDVLAKRSKETLDQLRTLYPQIFEQPDEADETMLNDVLGDPTLETQATPSAHTAREDDNDDDKGDEKDATEPMVETFDDMLLDPNGDGEDDATVLIDALVNKQPPPLPTVDKQPQPDEENDTEGTLVPNEQDTQDASDVDKEAREEERKKKEALEQDTGPKEYALTYPVRYMYRGIYLLRNELRVLYPEGVIRRIIIKPGQDDAMMQARKRAKRREQAMLNELRHTDMPEAQDTNVKEKEEPAQEPTQEQENDDAPVEIKEIVEQ